MILSSFLDPLFHVNCPLPLPGALLNWLLLPLPPPPPRLHGRFGLPFELMVMVDPSGTLMLSGILILSIHSFED